jgi:metal-responsive CopG/Arc/MetJ family transcriptional regulator
MKTAISVRDPLFKRADKFAKKEKISRSQLFSNAVEEYMNKHEADDLAANLNAVYSQEDSSVDPVLFKMALTSLPKEEWQ